jgi:hypothetical protein
MTTEAPEGEKSNRKGVWLSLNYALNGTLGLIYMLICYKLNETPDPLVMLAVFAAVGAGHSTANLANGLEHKHRKGA